MSSSNSKLPEKNKGPCQLCGAKVATSWRKIPATVPQAVGTTACNPCYVYLSKRAKDEPETLDEALALCRAAKRPCRSYGGDSSGSEGDSPSGGQSPGASDHSTGGFEQPLSGGGHPSPAAEYSTAPQPGPPPGQPSTSSQALAGGPTSMQLPILGLQPSQWAPQQWSQPQVHAAAAAAVAAAAAQQQQQQQQQAAHSGQRAQQTWLQLLAPQPPPEQALQQPARQQLQPPLQQPWQRSLEQQQQQQQQQQQSSPPLRQLLPSGHQQSSLLARQHSVPQAAPSSSPAPRGNPLQLSVDRQQIKSLQAATWRMACASEHTRQSLSSGLRAARQLQGSSPQLLGVLPTLWLLQSGTERQPEPVLGMLLGVLLPPRRLPAQLRGPQALLQRRAAGLEPALCLMVCCNQTGDMRCWRDWLQQDELPLLVHPNFGVPAWDSGDGWQLLFPHAVDDTTQASLFSRVVAESGLAPPQAGSPSPCPSPDRQQPGHTQAASPAPAVLGSAGQQLVTAHRAQQLVQQQQQQASPQPRLQRRHQPPLQLSPPPPLPQQQRQQQAGPLAPAPQQSSALGKRGSPDFAAPISHQAVQQPQLQRVPPQLLLTHPQLQHFASPHQPAQPQPQASLARVQAQQPSAQQQLFAPLLGSAFGSEISGLAPSWSGAAPPPPTGPAHARQAQQQVGQAQQQAQQVGQAQQAGQAQQVGQAQQAGQAQHDDLRSLLTDDEVAMLLDDLLEDPLLLPDLGPNFLL